MPSAQDDGGDMKRSWVLIPAIPGHLSPNSITCSLRKAVTELVHRFSCEMLRKCLWRQNCGSARYHGLQPVRRQQRSWKPDTDKGGFPNRFEEDTRNLQGEYTHRTPGTIRREPWFDDTQPSTCISGHDEAIYARVRLVASSHAGIQRAASQAEARFQ